MTHNFHPTSLREYDIRGIVGETLGEADRISKGRCFREQPEKYRRIIKK